MAYGLIKVFHNTHIWGNFKVMTNLHLEFEDGSNSGDLKFPVKHVSTWLQWFTWLVIWTIYRMSYAIYKDVLIYS